MATFTKFNNFVKDCAEKKHNLATDTLKVMLTNTAPIASNSYKSDLVDLSAVNGYTAGGNQAAQSTSSQTGGTYCLVVNDPATWTASGGSMGPFRYAVLYNDTPATDATKGLIGFWDYGASITLGVGESFRFDASQVAGVGILTIA